jgi:hypothetical protein
LGLRKPGKQEAQKECSKHHTKSLSGSAISQDKTQSTSFSIAFPPTSDIKKKLGPLSHHRS